MNKYVIELRPDCKVVQEICESDGQVSIGAKSINYLEELNSNYINEHFGDLQDTAYKKGLHDGESKCEYCNEYQKGLEDGKDSASRMCDGCRYEEEPSDDLHCGTCCRNYDDHFRGALKDTDEIRVGDEVQHGDSTGIVYEVGNLWLSGLCTGDESFVPFQWYKEECKKTGRRFETSFRQINEEETQ